MSGPHQIAMPDLTAHIAQAKRRQEARDDAAEKVAFSYSSFLDLAILRGDDTPMRTAWGRKPYPVSEILTDGCSAENRPLLFKACHLARAGKYEASAAALLAFIGTACQEFGRDMADEFAGDEE